jgi:hypothetical protein
MVFLSSFSLILAISVFTPSVVNAGLVQKPNLVLPPDAATHRDAVQTIFTESYKAYKYVNPIRCDAVDLLCMSGNLRSDMTTCLL